MTTEEAIKIINCYDIGFYDLSGEKIPAGKLVEAFDMAIKALQAEPIVRCKECKHLRLYNEDTHLIVCGYEWCAWWQRPVISTGYCHRGARMECEEE